MPTTIPSLAERDLAQMDGSNVDPKVRKFVEFYLKTRVPLKAYLYGFLKSSAAIEDCIQETCLVVWNKQQDSWTLDEYQKFSYTTARFKALSWLKKNAPSKHLQLSPELMEKLADKTKSVVNDERVTTLNECLAKLNDDHRAVLAARYESVDSKALATLAKKLNRKVDSLYKQLERLRTVLRDCVRKELQNK